jgi:NAD(P) transhydrogenase subunit beta
MSILIAVTGLATIFSGIIFNNFIIIVGAVLVGLTGIVLTIRMYKYMDCSLVAVLSGYTINSTKAKKTNSTNEMQRITAVETAQLLAASKKVAIVPGFGMAVAQAQHICYELQKNLMRLGTHFTYIIHPVAGRMPGHMNVLLAEANIDYTYIKDMDDVNDAMNQFDMAIIIGANDIVNPAAETDERSVIYGMPIIKAYQAKQVVVIKRGMATGYSGVRNLLLEKNNCKILFGDAKESLTKIINELKKI